ncbi:MAG: hypothetical protein FVQ82_14620 [Planctomycetes bacterium]|nr:hypothetical protein [Planctomycetota bacterium]
MINLLAGTSDNFDVTSLGMVIVLIAYVFIFALIIICLIRLAKYLGYAKNEHKLIRMELGKLAEEVHLIREDIKGSNPG